MSTFTLDMIRRAEELRTYLTSLRKVRRALKTTKQDFVNLVVNDAALNPFYVNMTISAVDGMLEGQIISVENTLRNMGVDPVDNDDHN